MTFEALKNDILNCTDCKDKFGFNPVPILHGKESSKILQISQAPSGNVHLTKKPFDDSTGKKLKYQWYQITDSVFYNEDNFYFTSLAHCFPGKSANGGDRLPPIACAQKWLQKELDLVNNEIYIILGSKPAKYIFPNESYNELIFKDNFLNGKTAIVLPHPSPLNFRWFKNHPNFENSRLPEIRRKISETLGLSCSTFAHQQ